MDHLKPLFNYLDAENISLDKEEFGFQFNSHPDYPSLLALSDALKFFNINNAAFKVEKTEIELLPNKFFAKLKKDNTDFLSFVEKKEDRVFYTNGTEKNHSVSKEDFEEIWDDVVLLAENDLKELARPKSKRWLLRSLVLITALLFVALVLMDLPNKWFVLFYAFPILGMFLSIAALKDLFKTKSALLDKFCNATAATSCNTVVNSSKWKFLETIGFSDLGIIFFSTQIGSLFLMGISNHYANYFFIQVILLLLSVPIIIASLYYQKYIEKKWCPICLTIIAVVLMELAYVLFLNNTLEVRVSISVVGLTTFLFMASIVTSIWYPLKNHLKTFNHLKTDALKANRFKRNYSLFKNRLLTSKHYNLPKSPLVFGNPNAALRLSIVTSPFCGHCTEPHYMLKSILDKYGEQLNISMLYNVNPKHTRLRDFVKNITRLKLKKGDASYYEAMDYYYLTKDYTKWFAKYKSKNNLAELETLLEKQHPWYVEQDINFTPCLFVNGYRYPKEYDLADLPFFIDELLDDKSYFEEKELKLAVTEKLEESRQ